MPKMEVKLKESLCFVGMVFYLSCSVLFLMKILSRMERRPLWEARSTGFHLLEKVTRVSGPGSVCYTLSIAVVTERTLDFEPEHPGFKSYLLSTSSDNDPEFVSIPRSEGLTRSLDF